MAYMRPDALDEKMILQILSAVRSVSVEQYDEVSRQSYYTCLRVRRTPVLLVFADLPLIKLWCSPNLAPSYLAAPIIRAN